MSVPLSGATVSICGVSICGAATPLVSIWGVARCVSICGAPTFRVSICGVSICGVSICGVAGCVSIWGVSICGLETPGKCALNDEMRPCDTLGACVSVVSDRAVSNGGGVAGTG